MNKGFIENSNLQAEKNPGVSLYLDNVGKWHDEMEELRGIVLGKNLKEELKWGKPCYSYQNNNVVLIHGFKDYCALLFIKGALLKDTHGILVRQTENVQAARQIRFAGMDDILRLESRISEYIDEAIEIEISGLQVEFKKTTEYNIPDELRKKMNDNAGFRDSFHTLTPGRQREYILYFSSAKQSSTREARIDKYMQKILDGKGMKDN